MQKIFQLAADEWAKPLRRAKGIDIRAEIEQFPVSCRRVSKYFMDIATMFEGIHSFSGVSLSKK
jgi:hypothetical protein